MYLGDVTLLPWCLDGGFEIVCALIKPSLTVSRSRRVMAVVTPRSQLSVCLALLIYLESAFQPLIHRSVSVGSFRTEAGLARSAVGVCVLKRGAITAALPMQAPWCG